jgi:Leucine-rich repeat (LRR) protein
MLDLSGLKLSVMPNDWTRELQRSHCFDSMDTNISVTSINFSNNCLQGIPKELFTSQFASSLRELVLTSNELGGRIHRDPRDQNPLIPACIKQLNLSKNKLSSHEVSLLLTGIEGSRPEFSLLHLLLPYNLLDSIPASLSLHTCLRELQLSSNRLTTLLPLDFGRFPHLTILDVSNNQITDLSNVHEARALQTLLLENNNLSHVPAELAFLEKVNLSHSVFSPQTFLNFNLLYTNSFKHCLYLATHRRLFDRH